MNRPPVEVLHVGSASRDVADDDARGWRLGGAVVYAALATARLGLRTAAVVGVDRAAASASELEGLRTAGVELLLVPLAECPVFRNTETPAGRVQVAMAAGIPLERAVLPEHWLGAPAWSLVPVAGELGQDWLEGIPEHAIVSVGWQGLLRTIVGGQRVERRPAVADPLLARADLVGVSHQDLAPTTRLGDLAGLLAGGARLVVTQGDRGGLLITKGAPGPGGGQVMRYPPIPADREVDPTGAGDTFLAALLAAHVRPDLAGPGGDRRDGTDLRFAAAAGSLAVEAVGLDGVPDLAAVRRRQARPGPGTSTGPSLDALVGSPDDGRPVATTTVVA